MGSQLQLSRMVWPVDFGTTHSNPEITYQEITQAVKSSPPNKAPGEDGIPNSLWHKLIEILTVLDTISRIYNVCVQLGTNPSHFQKSITVVLRKAGKKYYQLAKSYLGGRKGISVDYTAQSIIGRVQRV
ncbi:hypothetical protein AAEP93_002257 [Penicillium crustosum]